MELSNTPRAAASAGGGLDDQVYQRLLKERIIFLGSVVEDSMATMYFSSSFPCRNDSISSFENI